MVLGFQQGGSYQPIPTEITKESDLPRYVENKQSWKFNNKVVIGIVAASMSLFLASIAYNYKTIPITFEKFILEKDGQAKFDADGRYVFENYDDVKPMSNFLAGLGGLWGVPMWAFYVNRGQGITSFGVQNKGELYIIHTILSYI